MNHLGKGRAEVGAVCGAGVDQLRNLPKKGGPQEGFTRQITLVLCSVFGFFNRTTMPESVKTSPASVFTPSAAQILNRVV